MTPNRGLSPKAIFFPYFDNFKGNKEIFVSLNTIFPQKLNLLLKMIFFLDTPHMKQGTTMLYLSCSIKYKVIIYFLLRLVGIQMKLGA